MENPNPPSARHPDPTSETVQKGEFDSGNRGDLSGRNQEQSRATGQDDPVAEGSRQGRERYKPRIDGSADDSSTAI